MKLRTDFWGKILETLAYVLALVLILPLSLFALICWAHGSLLSQPQE